MAAPKVRLFWEDAPEGHDPADSGWHLSVRYAAGGSMTQGYGPTRQDWEDALTDARVLAWIESGRSRIF
jgi:hypothetical protein